MIELDLDPITVSPLMLSLASDLSRSPREAPPTHLANRFSIGAPLVLKLDAELLAADQEAVSFLAQNPSSRFYLVRLACTFDNLETEPFEQAWLEVALDADSLAWSMRPTKDVDFEDRSTKWKLEGGIKLAEVGYKALNEQVETQKKELPFLSAKGLQESSPRWHFRRTPMRALDGSFPLALVVRAPTGKKQSGRINFKATVERTRFGLLTYEIDATVAPVGLSFDLE